MNDNALEILNAIRRQLPVGYIPNHTNENLPAMVAYHVERSARLGKIEDEASAMLEDDDGIDIKTTIQFLAEIVDAAD
jgi:adenosine/AMP kinase